MPKTPIDFSKTIIYKIQKDDDFYVGSTTDFATRKSRHKVKCNSKDCKEYNFKLYQTIRDKGGWDTWEMTPLEEYVECQNRIQQRIREEEWRLNLNASLNMKKAFGAETTQEYHKQYRQEHAEELKIKKAQFYQEHKEEIKIKDAQYRQKRKKEIKTRDAQYYQEHANEIKAKMAVKYECECGLICSVGHKARHERSKKHQTYLAK